MTDISNNYNSNNINKIHNIHYENNNNKEVSFAGEAYQAEKEIKNLDNDHAAVVGRSMVNKRQVAFNGLSQETKACIKASLNKIKQNPELAAKTDAFFAAALKKGYSYEQAYTMAQSFGEELLS